MYEDSRTMSCVFAMQGFICNPCWHKGSSTYTVKNKDGKQILTGLLESGICSFHLSCDKRLHCHGPTELKDVDLNGARC